MFTNMQEKLEKVATFSKPHGSGLVFRYKKEKCEKKLKTGFRIRFE